MQTLRPILAVLIVALIFQCQNLAWADAPTKDSLITKWEASLADRPETKLLKKTDEPGVYEFETDLFPYKGKLRIVNALVVQAPDYEYGIDENDASHHGYVETKLVNAPDDFFKDMRRTSYEWDEHGHLVFSTAKQDWVTRTELTAITTAEAKPEPQARCAPASKPSKLDRIMDDMMQVTFMLIPAVLLLLFVVLFTRKARRAQLEQNALVVERQRESLQILSDILAELKKKGS